MTQFPKAARVAILIIAWIALALSLLIIVEIALGGRAIWQVADVVVLRASRLGRPLAVGALSAGTLLRLLSRGRIKSLLDRLSLRGWIFGMLLAVVAYHGLSGPHVLHGDGREYILQTQALAFDRSVMIQTEARRNYWNQTNPYGVTLGEARRPAATLSESSQAGGGFGGLYPDRFGDYRYYHYWAYSAAVAPVYYLFHSLDPSGDLEYFSFRFTNVCLLLAFFWLAFRQNPYWPALAILALLLFSPLIPYCDWQHPEIFCLTLVFAAFHLAGSRKTVAASPLLLGLAATMNPPLFLFFPCHGLIASQTVDAWRASSGGKLAAGYLVGVLAALSPFAYYLYYFRTPNVIVHVGLASLHYASVSRAMDIFFSPFVGAVFFFPMLLLLLPTGLQRKNWMTVSAVLASVFLVAWLAASTSNLNADQVGTVRYAVWLLAPLWTCLFRNIPERFSLTFSGGIMGVGLALSVLLILFFRTYELLDKDIRRFGGTWRAQQEVATLMRLLRYEGDAEILVENILGEEILQPAQFREVYLWDLGADSYLWIFSEPSLEQRCPVVLETENPDGFRFKASPAQPLEVTVNGRVVSLRLFDPPPRMQSHPVLGKFLTLRSTGRITKVLKNQSFRIRSATIEQVEALDASRQNRKRQ